MHDKRLAGLLFPLLLLAGCAGAGPTPRSVEPAAKAPPAPAENLPAPEKAPPAAVVQAPPAPAVKVPPAPAVKPVPAPVVKTAPAKVPASPAPVASPPQAEAAPALDLSTLEARLKETKAIGVFTKLTLKNQVDDLLDQFRAFYRGQVNSSLAELRQPYDRLLLKVLSLLQDGDPDLAHAIVSSREAIWSILADPAKFATL